MLAAVTGAEIITASSQTGTSNGAALLAQLSDLQTSQNDLSKTIATSDFIADEMAEQDRLFCLIGILPDRGFCFFRSLPHRHCDIQHVSEAI